ncbi:MAG: TonB-dependent receptor [Proteobacteria bacterium]|nr:TonB-dependent receptor [Pseudomonadota bacterium]
MTRKVFSGTAQEHARTAGAPAFTGLALVAAMVPLAVQAQTAAPAAQPSSDVALQEITVTAERRTSNLQTTPIAITAIDSNAIAQLAPNTLQDIAQLVPNFSANKINGFNAAAFAMRGVGNTDIIVYNEAPIAVLVDDFVMPSVQTQLLDPFDVQEIEVLRGPQGTLFGKNTTGGAVVVHTKAPELDKDSFEARAQAGSRNSYTVQGAINFALVENHLALRLVASEDKMDGWIRNGASDTIGGVTYHGDGSTLGGTDVFTARAKLLWQPIDSVKVNFMYEAVRDNSPTPGAVNTTPSDLNPATGFPYFVFPNLGLPGYTGNDPLNNGGTDNRAGYLVDIPRGHQVQANGYHLNTDWTISGGTFTWVQGWREQKSSLPSNYTGVVGPVSVFDANRSDDRKTWQEELRFASEQMGKFNYVAGLFYQHDDTAFCVAQILGIYDLFGVPTPPGTSAGGYNNNPQVLCNEQLEKSAAAYGEANYKFTDATTLTFGARLTQDKKDWTGRQQVFVQQLPNADGSIDPAFTWQELGKLLNAGDFNAYPFGVVHDNHTWTQPTFRLTLSHQFTPDIFGYGTYSHGFRAGGYNDQVGTSGAPITDDEKKPTNPEKADSFEVGMKSELWDRRLRLNEAVFYVQYKDAIRQVVVPVTNSNGQPGEETLFRNAAKFTVYGIESELTAQLAPGLLLHLPLSYQHCKYNEFTSGEGAALVDLSRLPVNRCPEWTATADFNYTLPLRDMPGTIVLDASANYVSKNLDTYSIALPYEPFTQTYADARTLVDASITYNAPNDRWFVRVLGKNLTDKTYVESSQNVDPLWVWSFYGEPRYVGAQAGIKF